MLNLFSTVCSSSMRNLCLWFVSFAGLEVRSAVTSFGPVSSRIDSAFVGMGVMLICFPIPSLIIRRMQTMQQHVMKKSDARVQTVTESKSILLPRSVIPRLTGISLSDECPEDDQNVWLGA